MKNDERGEECNLQILLAKILGQPGCDDLETGDFKKYWEKWEPSRKILLKEYRRRLPNLVADPISQSSKKVAFVDWLIAHPVVDRQEIEQLQSQFHHHKAQYQEQMRAEAVAHGDEGVEDNGTSNPRNVLVRALGLPDCDYQQAPFQQKRKYTPTHKQLVAECKRRLRILQVQKKRSNNWKIPSSAWKADALADWLRANVTLSQDEAKELTCRVKMLQTQLSDQGGHIPAKHSLEITNTIGVPNKSRGRSMNCVAILPMASPINTRNCHDSEFVEAPNGMGATYQQCGKEELEQYDEKVDDAFLHDGDDDDFLKDLKTWISTDDYLIGAGSLPSEQGRDEDQEMMNLSSLLNKISEGETPGEHAFASMDVVIDPGTGNGNDHPVYAEWTNIGGVDSMVLSSPENSVMKMSLKSFEADSGSKQSSLFGSSSNPSTLSSFEDGSKLTPATNEVNRLRGGGGMETVVESNRAAKDSGVAQASKQETGELVQLNGKEHHDDLSQSQNSVGESHEGLSRTAPSIYGRSHQIDQLASAHERVKRSRKPELCLLKGPPGVGKSLLAKQLKQVVDEGYFLYGKQEEMGSSRPFHAIVDAFANLHTTLAREDLSSLRDRVQRCIGTDICFLRQFIPRIIELLGLESSSCNEDISTQTQRHWVFERIKTAFRDFVRVLTRHGATIALVIDDLQWADASSLELLQFLLTDKKAKGLLFVGVYRDNLNGGDASPQLHIRIREILEKSIFRPTEISVDNLDERDAENFVADVIGLSPKKVRPLAKVVYDRTHGNAFFMIQLLDKLRVDDLWKQCINLGWGSADIDQATHMYDVDTLVSDKISTLDGNTKELLQIASCFGSSFHFDLVSEIVAEKRRNGDTETHRCEMEAALQTATERELVCQSEDGRFNFTHDKLRQAVYALGEVGQPSMHLRIGKHLERRRCSETWRDWMFLLLVSQLNLGRTLITDKQRLLHLAELNLEAAEAAKSKGAFAPALEYLDTGVAILRNMDGWNWRCNLQLYNVQLDMQSTRAEVLYCVGNMDDCKNCCDEVIKHARETKDKHRVWIVKIDVLGSSLKFSDALNLGFKVLRELGEQFPRKPCKLHQVLSFISTSILLGGKTDTDLEELPLIEDESKLFALDVISSLAMHSFPFNKDLEVGLLIMRMIQITLKHGLSKHSSRAFSAWAYVQGKIFNFDGAKRFGKLAIKLACRFQGIAGKDCEGRCLRTNAIFVGHLQQPLSRQLSPLLKAHQYGMESGDVCHASVAAGCYTMAHFFSGLPLYRFLEVAKLFQEEQRRYEQVSGEPLVVVPLQAAMNLMGKATDPVVLTGDAMDQAEYIASLDENTARIKVQTLRFGLLTLSVFFHDVRIGEATVESLWKSKTDVDGCIFYMPAYLMYVSLACLDVWKNKRKQRKFRKQARLHARELKKWVDKDSFNTRHKLVLLQAEHEATKPNPNPSRVMGLYGDAIFEAKEAGFTQDAALASERTWRYLAKKNDKESAFKYWCRAIELYTKWNAWGKLTQLLPEYFDPRSVDQLVRRLECKRTNSETALDWGMRIRPEIRRSNLEDEYTTQLMRAELDQLRLKIFGAEQRSTPPLSP